MGPFMIHTNRVLLAMVLVCAMVGCFSNMPPPRLQASQQANILDGWGTPTDPASDCRLNAENGKLTITIPGGTHDLSPTSGGMSAPRVLRKIEGDFRAQVKVTGEFKPGDKAHSPKTVPYNAAGLLIWHDNKNYVRFEAETGGWQTRTGTLLHPRYQSISRMARRSSGRACTNWSCSRGNPPGSNSNGGGTS